MSLLKNNKYTVTVTIAGRRFSEYFYTELEPMYNTISAVRNSEIGPYLSAIGDEEILFKLFDISKKAKSLAEKANLTWDDGENPPEEVINFTLEKAKYDLLLYRVYYANQQYDSASLADFDISSVSYKRVKPLFEELKEEIKYWKDQIRGGAASPRSVLKSEDSSPYPLGDRMSF